LPGGGPDLAGRRRRNLRYSASRARAVLVLVWQPAREAGRPPDRAL